MQVDGMHVDSVRSMLSQVLHIDSVRNGQWCMHVGGVHNGQLCMQYGVVQNCIYMYICVVCAWEFLDTEQEARFQGAT